MSLETLLEAAEFLEARGQGDQTKKSFTGTGKNSSTRNESAFVRGDNEGSFSDDGHFKEPKIRTKSGKLSPIYVGPPDSFYMRAGTREVHNKLEKNRKVTKGKDYAPYASSTHNWLEKNRRAHLKECFDFLKKNIPYLQDKRTSNLGILRSSLHYIQKLKRKEHEFEAEMQKFAREKIILQERMQSLMGELNKMEIEVDLNMWISAQEQDNETNSTSTATERGTPPPSDHDENDDDEEEAEKLVMEGNPSPTPKSAANKKMASIKELLGNGASSKVADAVQGLMSAQDMLDHMRPVALSQSLPKNVSPSISSTSRPNGVVPQIVPTQIFKTPAAKKTIPITLSLSGPVQQGTSSAISRIPQTVTSAVIGPSEHSVLMSSQKAGKPAVSVEPVHGMGALNPANKTILIGQREGLVPTSTARISWTPQAGAQLENQPCHVTSMAATLATRTPVTQILHRTLTQRQALLKQSMAGSPVSSAPLTAAHLKTPPLSQPNVIATTTVTGAEVKNSNIPTPVLQLMSSNPSITPNKTGTSAVSVNVPLTVPYYVASLPKVAHPILVTSLMGQGLAATTSATVLTSVPMATTASTKVDNAPATTLSTVSGLTSPVVTASAVRPDAAPASSGIPVRPVFAPNLLGGQLAWPFLTTIPRSTVVVPSTPAISSVEVPTVTGPVSTTTAGQVASIPIGSLPQLNQLTQLMTVMSPGVQVAPVGLNQQQLLASPLLKQFQFPLGIQSTVMPSGQVLGGQVVKPVMVVTVPSVVTQTTAPTTVTMVTSAV